MDRRLVLLVCRPLSFVIFAFIAAVALNVPGGAQVIRPQSDMKPIPGASAPGYVEDTSTPSLKGSQMLKTEIHGPGVDTSHESYAVEFWQVTWRTGDPIEVYLLRPIGVAKPPVILNLFGFPNDLDPYKKEAVQKDMVNGGFAVVGFASALTGQRYHDVPLSMWFLSSLRQSLAFTAHDVQLMIDFVQRRGDLDTSRIGMFANGSSGAIAILASAVDPRIKVLDVLDPWADWPTWLANSPFPPADERANFLKPEFLKSISTLETLDYLPKVQAKKFRIEDAVINPETPAPIKEKIRKAAPEGTVFVQYKTREEFMAAFPHSSNLDWLKQQISALPGADKTEKTSAEKQ
jgi:hypothetical protein